MSTDGVLDAIDSALDDFAVSEDAMRSAPDSAGEAPGSPNLFWGVAGPPGTQVDWHALGHLRSDGLVFDPEHVAEAGRRLGEGISMMLRAARSQIFETMHGLARALGVVPVVDRERSRAMKAEYSRRRRARARRRR